MFSLLYSGLNLTNFEILFTKHSTGDEEYSSAYGMGLCGGDFNQDGYSDIVIGIIPEDLFILDTSGVIDTVIDTVLYPGVIQIFFGGPLLDTLPDIMIPNPFLPDSELAARSDFSRVLMSGDFTGDSYVDLVAELTDGSFCLFKGKSGGIDTFPYLIFRGGIGFGRAFSKADVNGDGYLDIIAGEYYYGGNKGRVCIFYGGPFIDTFPDIILKLPSDANWGNFGWSTSGFPDINNDGCEEVLVGAPNYPDGGRGAIFLYYGGNPMDTIPDLIIWGESQGIFGDFAYRLRYMKDFNGGGMPDIITVDPGWYGEDTTASGKVYVYFGENFENFDSIPDMSFVARDSGYFIGIAVLESKNASSPYSMFVIGDPGGWSDYPSFVYLYTGGINYDTLPDGEVTGYYVPWVSDSVGAGLSFYPSSAGDVDGDGVDELLIQGFWDTDSETVWLLKYTGPLPYVFENKEKEKASANGMKIGIYDIQGRKLKSIKLPSGTYFILQKKQNKLFKRKILKIK